MEIRAPRNVQVAKSSQCRVGTKNSRSRHPAVQLARSGMLHLRRAASVPKVDLTMTQIRGHLAAIARLGDTPTLQEQMVPVPSVRKEHTVRQGLLQRARALPVQKVKLIMTH